MKLTAVLYLYYYSVSMNSTLSHYTNQYCSATSKPLFLIPLVVFGPRAFPYAQYCTCNARAPFNEFYASRSLNTPSCLRRSCIE